MQSALRSVPGACTVLAVLFGAGAALAQEAAPAASGLDSGDVAWVLTSSAIVLMMTIPGLALFYGGLVRSKNVLSIFMLCFVTAALVSVTWVLWGYSIAFGPDVAEMGLFGSVRAHFGLQGVSWEAGPDESIPKQLFMVFQLMFAIITPALIVGAIAERMKFAAFFLFVLLWSTFIYSPLCHWVWGGGWLGARGALDFAGGTVVHISSGVSALVASAMIGHRRGYGHDPMPPHNVPFVVAGAALLWVGWFGFNAGSALAANGIATVAFVNTNTATGAAVLGWMFTEWIGRGKPTAVGAASGAVAGLVAITPAAGFVEPMSSILIGAVAGFLCYHACNFKRKVGYDDALDVVGVHGVGGTWGALATGALASAALSGGASWVQLKEQAIAVLSTYALCGFGTFVILGLIKSVVGLRVEDEDEATGLDLTLHAESAYSGLGSGGGASLIGERPAGRPAALIAPRPAPASARSPGGSMRQPPVIQREAPRPAAAEASARSAAPTNSGGGGRSFRLVVDGVEPARLASWWRELCTKDHGANPPAFRELYPKVRSFEGNAFQFRSGDPSETREQLSYLLDIYGVPVSGLRVEQT